MSFVLNIKTHAGQKNIELATGRTIIFVGANGGGKTRLAVRLEEQFGAGCHRISAHRALNLNQDVAKIREELALRGLREGNHQIIGLQRAHNRWNQKAATWLLNDYDYLLQALFADQSKITLDTHQKARSGPIAIVNKTKFERLEEIWRKILPHRQLHFTGDEINVSVPGDQKHYNASEMSDGERAIFYIIGQVLVAAYASLLIFDEPELHVHRSIMSKLWDELEAARPDCAFILITHDLEFASARVGEKYAIRDYTPDEGWIIEPIPEETGFSEHLATLILGSRKPILFVEGAITSLDRMIYRACYPEWTVVTRNSCEQVIHSVVTMRANEALTRVSCSGLVDADDFDPTDAENLRKYHVSILPVSEIENLFLLPDVSKAIAEGDGYSGSELTDRLLGLRRAIFARVNQPGAVDDVVARYCRRRIDRALKKIDLHNAKSIEQMAESYRMKTSLIDIAQIAHTAERKIRKCVEEDNLVQLLSHFDDKSFMSLAASHLRGTSKSAFEAWLSRVLRSGSPNSLITAIRCHLPSIEAH